VIRKLLSVRLARDDGFDVNSHSFPSALIWTWRAVDAWRDPPPGKDKKKAFHDAR